LDNTGTPKRTAEEAMAKSFKATSIEVLACDAG
jgi:hypothetical protein